VGWEKVACWITKAAISLKRIMIEESYYGGPIGSHQRSFEWYHPRPHTTSSSPRLGFTTPNQNSDHIQGASHGHCCDDTAYLLKCNIV